MKIEQMLMTYKGFSVKLIVSDNEEGTNPRFFSTHQKGAYLNYSVFLALSIKKTDPKNKSGRPGPNDVYQSIMLSIFDMRKLKEMLSTIENIVTGDYYEAIEHPDEGIKLQFLPQYRKFLISMTNSTNKNQFGLGLKMVIDRALNEYKPVVMFLVNDDSSAMTMDIDRFLSFCMCLMELDLHSSARSIITAHTAYSTNKRSITEKASRSIQIEEP